MVSGHYIRYLAEYRIKKKGRIFGQQDIRYIPTFNTYTFLNGTNATARHKFFTWKTDDTHKPVSVLVDGHDDKVLVEQVHLLRPLAHAVVALLGGREVGIVLHRMEPERGSAPAAAALPLAGGPGGEPLVEVGGEDVGPLQHSLAVLVLPVLQVSG
jgi:hypothetical protein